MFNLISRPLSLGDPGCNHYYTHDEHLGLIICTICNQEIDPNSWQV